MSGPRVSCFSFYDLTFLLPPRAFYLLLEVGESQGTATMSKKLRRLSLHLLPLYAFLEKSQAAGTWASKQEQPSLLGAAAGSVPHLTLNYLSRSWLLMILGSKQSSLDLSPPPSLTCCNLLLQLHTDPGQEGGEARPRG